MSEIILVGSGKGGTGKTSVVAGVASALALGGQSVICLDLDAGFRNLDLALGLADRALRDYGDYLSGDYGTDDIIIPHPDIEGLSIVSAPQYTVETDALSGIPGLVKELSMRADYVFIDCPPGMREEIRLVASICSKAILVATPNIYSLRDAQSFCAFISDKNACNLILVVNMVIPNLINRNAAYDIDEIIDATGVSLIGCIPDDPDVMVCANCCTPVMLYKSAGAAKAYENIAARLTGADVPLMRL